MREKIEKMRTQLNLFTAAYDAPGTHRTSNLLDRLMQRMDRHLFCMRYFHGGLVAAEYSIRAWALINNFALSMSGLQKGAFHHHFASKAERDYAVPEQQTQPLVESVRLEPLSEIEDPVRVLPRMLDRLGQHIGPSTREHGCPLNNLAQEIATQDDGLRQRIAQVFDDWIGAVAAVFEQGKRGGYIRDHIDSRCVARFVVAVLEGCIGVFKVEHSAEQWTVWRSRTAA